MFKHVKWDNTRTCASREQWEAPGAITVSAALVVILEQSCPYGASLESMKDKAACVTILLRNLPYQPDYLKTKGVGARALSQIAV